jgi:hypothetical protein
MKTKKLIVKKRIVANLNPQMKKSPVIFMSLHPLCTIALA